MTSIVSQRAMHAALWYTIGGFFLFAALGKVLDARGVLAVLTYLAGNSGASQQALVVVSGALVGRETFLGLAAVLGYRRRWIAISLVATLVVFTAVLAFLVQNPKAPGCGWVGLIKLASDSHGEAKLGIARNLAMVWMVLWLLISKRQNTPPRERVDPQAGRDERRSPAFTLVELLFVIATTAILVGLVAPSFRLVRETAKDTSSVAMERQCIAALALYSHDFQDALPYFQTIGDPEGPIRIGDVSVRHSYFRAGAIFWPNMLFPTYLSEGRSLGGADSARTRESNEVDGYPEDFIRSRYWLTNAAHATNAYWTGEHAPPDARLLRGSRLGDVVFPSDKGLILDIVGGVFSEAKNDQEKLAGAALVGFADGSARPLPWRPNEPGLFVFRELGAADCQVMTTISGLAGLDLAK